jgi:hypothetical protein
MSMLDRISGIEGLALNFYGSQAASDMEIAFKNVSYYSSYTPKVKVSKDQSSDTPTEFDLGDGLWPGNTSSTAGSSGGDPSFSPESSTVDQPLPKEIVQADLVNGAQNLPRDLSSVPEPRYFAVEMLFAGLATGIWLKLRRGRQVS